MDHPDPTRTNMNCNNNKGNWTKPNVPSKPQHLTGLKNPSAPVQFSRDIITPKGWSQPKFLFGQADPKNNDSHTDRYSSSVSDERSTPKWRPVPKVMQKQASVKESNEANKPRKIKEIAQESHQKRQGEQERSGMIRPTTSIE